MSLIQKLYQIFAAVSVVGLAVVSCGEHKVTSRPPATANFPPSLSKVKNFAALVNTRLSISYDDLLKASDAADGDTDDFVSFQLISIQKGTLNVGLEAILSNGFDPWFWTPPTDLKQDGVVAFTIRAVDSYGIFSDHDVTVSVDISNGKPLPTMTKIDPLEATSNLPRVLTFGELLASSDATAGQVGASVTGFKLMSTRFGTLNVQMNAVLTATSPWQWQAPANFVGNGKLAFSVQAVNEFNNFSPTIPVIFNISDNKAAPVFTGSPSIDLVEDTSVLVTFARLLQSSTFAPGDKPVTSFKLADLRSGTLLSANSHVVVGDTLDANSPGWNWTPDLNAHGAAVPAFSVRAINTVHVPSSAQAVVANITATAPQNLTNLTAMATEKEISLAWAASADATGYKIAYATGANAPANCLQGSAVPKGSSFLLTGLAANTQYSLRLCPVDGTDAIDMGQGLTATLSTFDPVLFSMINSNPGVGGVAGLATDFAGGHIYAVGANVISHYNIEKLKNVMSFDNNPLGFSAGAGGGGGDLVIKDASDVAMSPDGQNVYVISAGSTSILRFKPDTTGKLASTPVPASVKGFNASLDKASSMTIPIDGRHIYVAAAGNTGSLTILGRALDSGDLSLAGQLVNGENSLSGLSAVNFVTNSPDGRFIYTSSPTEGLVIFSRAMDTGFLTKIQNVSASTVAQLRGTKTITIDPTGSYVYSASAANENIMVFRRNHLQGTLSSDPLIIGKLGRISSFQKLVVSGLGNYLFAIGTDDAHISYLAMYARRQSNGSVPANGTLFLRQEIQISASGDAISLVGGPDEDSVFVGTGGSEGKIFYFKQSISPAAGRPLVDQQTPLVSALGKAIIYPKIPKALRSRDNRFAYRWELQKIKLSLIPSFGVDLAAVAQNFDAVDPEGRKPNVCALKESFDGKNIYALGTGAILVFDKDSETGVLTSVSSIDNAGFECLDDGNASLDLSQDGGNLYAAGSGANIISFTRNRINGALSNPQIQAVSGSAGLIKSLVASRDGRNIYATASNTSSIVIQSFSRNPLTGLLDAPSPTEATVVGSTDADINPVLFLSRDQSMVMIQTSSNAFIGSRSTITSSPVRLAGAGKSAFSDDNRFVYRANSSILTSFSIDPNTGLPTATGNTVNVGNPESICESNGFGLIFLRSATINRVLP